MPPSLLSAYRFNQTPSYAYTDKKFVWKDMLISEKKPTVQHRTGLYGKISIESRGMRTLVVICKI
jgi:hypothetical protein